MLKNNFLYSTLTTLSRLISGFLLIFVLARLLPVEKFGVFTYALVFSNIIVLIVEYGYNLKLSKDTAKEINRIGELTVKAAKVKLVLFAFVLLVLCILLILEYTDLDTFKILSILTVSAVFNSFANHFLIPYRSKNRFDVESRYVFINNIIVFSLVCSVAYCTTNLLYIAIAFLISKIIYAISTSYRFFKDNVFINHKINLINELKSAFPYAVHIAVGAMYLNVDTVILKEFVNNYDIGIYQAGMRALGAATIGLGIFNSVLTPRFSNLSNNIPELIKLAKKSNRYIIIFGFLVTIIINVFAENLILLIFSEKFIELSVYVMLFSVIIFLRYFGVVYGTLLTISDNQKVRTYAVSLTLLFIVVLDLFLVPKYNLYGALYTLIIAHIILNLIYVISTFREYKTLFLR